MSQADDSASGATVTVLAVAPEADLAAFRRMFEHSRWKLVEASTFAEATLRLGQGSASVLICDAELPDGTWIDLLVQTQRLPIALPVIVISRSADDDLWMDVLNRGGYNVLGKPFTEHDVFEMVSVAWRHRKDRVPLAQAAG